MKYKRGTLIKLQPDRAAARGYFSAPAASSEDLLRGIVLEAEEGIRPLPVYLIRWASEPTPEWVYEDSLCEV